MKISVFNKGGNVIKYIKPEITRIIIFGLLLCLAPPLTENVFSQSSNSFSSKQDYSFSAGYEQLFETDIDDGGDFKRSTLGINFETKRTVNRQFGLSMNASYSYSYYDFSGNTGFPGLDPWQNINSAGLNIGARYRITEKFGLFASPFINFAGESGAEFGDSVSGGAISGLTFTRDRNLTVGAGLIVASRLEDDTLIIPIPILNWQINSRFNLSTTGGNAAIGKGGNLALNYISGIEGLRIGVSVGYISERFRLDDSGTAENGVGEFQYLPVTVSLAYNLSKNVNIDLYTGAGFIGEMEIEDSDGDRISKKDFDTVPVFGGGITVRF